MRPLSKDKLMKGNKRKHSNVAQSHQFRQKILGKAQKYQSQDSSHSDVDQYLAQLRAEQQRSIVNCQSYQPYKGATQSIDFYNTHNSRNVEKEKELTSKSRQRRSNIFTSHAASKDVSKFEMFPERHKINATENKPAENIPIHNTRYQGLNMQRRRRLASHGWISKEQGKSSHQLQTSIGNLKSSQKPQKHLINIEGLQKRIQVQSKISKTVSQGFQTDNCQQAKSGERMSAGTGVSNQKNQQQDNQQQKQNPTVQSFTVQVISTDNVKTSSKHAAYTKQDLNTCPHNLKQRIHVQTKFDNRERSDSSPVYQLTVPRMSSASPINYGGDASVILQESPLSPKLSHFNIVGLI